MSDFPSNATIIALVAGARKGEGTGELRALAKRGEHSRVPIFLSLFTHTITTKLGASNGLFPWNISSEGISRLKNWDKIVTKN